MLALWMIDLSCQALCLILNGVVSENRARCSFLCWNLFAATCLAHVISIVLYYHLSNDPVSQDLVLVEGLHGLVVGAALVLILSSVPLRFIKSERHGAK